MADIVFILGAGASRDCGGPLMSDFLDSALRLHSIRDAGAAPDHHDTVFDAIGRLQQVHSKAQLDIKNIESIFTAFEMGRTIGRLADLDPAQIPAVIDALKQLIVTTLEELIEFPYQGTELMPPSSYRDFAGLVTHLKVDAFPRRTAAILTFNYDVAVDLAFYRTRSVIDYGLADPNRHPGSTQLYKLHGSLNWGVEDQSGDIRVLSFDDYFRLQGLRMALPADMPATGSLRIGSELQHRLGRLGIAAKSQPFIVPPSWHKADYQRIIEKVWSAAAAHLSEAKEIYVMGYSLPDTDQFFRMLYALGSVGRRPLQRFSVCNIDNSPAFQNRFRALLGPGAEARFESCQWDFREACRQIKQRYPGRR